MMIRKTMIMGLIAMFLSAASGVWAEEVHVTEKGARYHKEICRLIKNKNTNELEKEIAITNDYTPCRICFKEDVAQEEK